jgi:hypothetical protein
MSFSRTSDALVSSNTHGQHAFTLFVQPELARYSEAQHWLLRGILFETGSADLFPGLRLQQWICAVVFGVARYSFWLNALHI